jgi:hypothetical protein
MLETAFKRKRFTAKRRGKGPAEMICSLCRYLAIVLNIAHNDFLTV